FLFATLTAANFGWHSPPLFVSSVGPSLGRSLQLCSGAGSWVAMHTRRPLRRSTAPDNRPPTRRRERRERLHSGAPSPAAFLPARFNRNSRDSPPYRRSFRARNSYGSLRRRSAGR